MLASNGNRRYVEHASKAAGGCSECRHGNGKAAWEHVRGAGTGVGSLCLSRSLPGLALFLNEHGSPLNVAERQLQAPEQTSLRSSPVMVTPDSTRAERQAGSMHLAKPLIEWSGSTGTGASLPSSRRSSPLAAYDLHAPHHTLDCSASMTPYSGVGGSWMRRGAEAWAEQWPEAPPLPFGAIVDSPVRARASSSGPTRRALFAALESVGPSSPEPRVDRSMPSSSAWMLLREVREPMPAPLAGRQATRCWELDRNGASAAECPPRSSSGCSSPSTPALPQTPLQARHAARDPSPTLSDIEAALESMPTPPRSGINPGSHVVLSRDNLCKDAVERPSPGSFSEWRSDNSPCSIADSVDGEVCSPIGGRQRRCAASYSLSPAPPHTAPCMRESQRRSFSLAAARDQFKTSVGASARSSEFRRARLQVLDTINSSLPFEAC